MEVGVIASDTEEQAELRAVVRQFLEKTSGDDEVRRLMETTAGYDEKVWRQMATDLELQALAIPEVHGGSGFSFADQAVVLEEMGAALLCAPYFSTVVLAANALLTSGDRRAMADYLPAIAAGESFATLAVTEDDGRWDLPGVAMAAVRADDGWTLSGTKSYVLDGHVADVILVAARTSRGISLFAVLAGAAGLSREALSTLDLTRRMSSLTFAATPARLIGVEGMAVTGLVETLQLAAIALAAEQVGGARRVLAQAVGYAKSRLQFGRPIGSFQAIKHKCADLLVEVELAGSVMRHAAKAADAPGRELAVAAAMAKSHCSETYLRAAAANIQIHGGIGFTWEHPAHLYFKRAKSAELLFGDPEYHRAILATELGLAP
jgi:alkylation response protein AidB-like acyl-CoA dehydrogenase